VTANSPTITYGQPIPALSATYSGFVNNESSSVINGAPALSTTPTSPSNAGSYPITVTTGTLAATNYSFLYVPGTLTIQAANQAPLTLTTASPLAINQSEPLNISGGSTGGALTYNVTGACSASNGQLTANSGSGSCTVSVTMAGNTNYSPVTSNSVTVNLQPASQAGLVLTAASPLTYNQSETLSVTGGTDGGLITYTAIGSAGVTCSVTSGKLSANSGTGTCTVSAMMAGNGNYNPVSSNTVIVTLQVAAHRRRPHLTVRSRLRPRHPAGSRSGSRAQAVALIQPPP
jgi:hypothetical protein